MLLLLCTLLPLSRSRRATRRNTGSHASTESQITTDNSRRDTSSCRDGSKRGSSRRIACNCDHIAPGLANAVGQGTSTSQHGSRQENRTRSQCRQFHLGVRGLSLCFVCRVKVVAEKFTFRYTKVKWDPNVTFFIKGFDWSVNLASKRFERTITYH